MISSFRSVPKPAENISKITPISAIPEMNPSYDTKLSMQGPTIRPAIISPTTCGAPSFLATMPRSFAATRIMARFFRISSVLTSITSFSDRLQTPLSRQSDRLSFLSYKTEYILSQSTAILNKYFQLRQKSHFAQMNEFFNFKNVQKITHIHFHTLPSLRTGMFSFMSFAICPEITETDSMSSVE